MAPERDAVRAHERMVGAVRTDRRRFLLGAAAAGATLAAGACGWDGRSLVPRLMQWSNANDWVSARLFSSSRLAREYAVAQRSRERDFPAYFVSAGGMPALKDPAAWRLEVGGLVRKPAVLTLERLMALPRLRYTVKHHCVEGWTAIATWAGVPLATIAALVEPLPSARFVDFRSFDAGYSNGWDLPSAMHPQTILAYAYNDRPLMPDHGAPLRLYSPTKLGYKNTKYLTAVEFTAARPGGYWEDQGYPWFGGL